jgi:hypothetical protein
MARWREVPAQSILASPLAATPKETYGATDSGPAWCREHRRDPGPT